MSHEHQSSHDQEHASSRVLQLDQAMRHQAIMESLSLCQEMLSLPIPSDLQRSIHQVALRLGYVLSHDPPPHLDPSDLRQLVQASQHFLAQSLRRSADPSMIHLALRNLTR